MSTEPNASSTKDQHSNCVHCLILKWANQTPDAIAIAAPGRKPLTYRHLNTHIQNVVKTLNAMGISRNDRVAIVLPNGPEMAVAFLAVASGATSAPLNPGYRASEYDFYLSDLNSKALIVEDMDSPAVAIAQKRGIPVIKLSPAADAEAGIFKLDGNADLNVVGSDFAQPEDVALVLHTSGTTSRPKIVPLTHSNICASAHNIKTTLKLAPNDRCLNIMPLFHIHGLIGATLSSISAGASVVCTPGFFAPKFFEWMEEFHPTWYTAVPTMHQAILARALAKGGIIEKIPLRFIRSSSAALPPQVMADLEDLFNAPVIESYGMTEASHQMTSNLLPPGNRKPGSVGVQAGPEVAIMDEEGILLSAGETGEIVIRGQNVTQGYENNPEANEKAFTNGWFRTGDQGYMDDDRYLFITGRLKEIINRGGEKIAPGEVDLVLMDYPDIVQAVTFAIPHNRLGEDVAAAVVLREGARAKERHIQEFVAERLASFKVPRRIVILNEIPKGPTGKLQRIGLAEKLGLADLFQSLTKTEYVAPRTPAEKKLAAIWEEVIVIDQVGVYDNFFDLGGDSMLAAQMLVKVKETFGKALTVTVLLQAPTVEQMAKILTQRKWSPSYSTLVPIQPNGSKKPLFFIHGCLCEVMNYFDLARHLGPDQPFYALRAQGIYGEKAPHRKIESMAAHYIKEIKSVQPEGPYFLGGGGAGGFVALEIAQQLLKQDQEVDLLVVIDAIHHAFMRIQPPARESSTDENLGPTNLSQKLLVRYVQQFLYYIKRRQFGYILKGIRNVLRFVLKKLYQKFRWSRLCSVLIYSFALRHIGFIRRRIDYMQQVRTAFFNIGMKYIPNAYPGNVIYFMPEASEKYFNKEWYIWAGGGLELRVFPGKHTNILREPQVQAVAEQLQILLAERQKR